MACCCGAGRWDSRILKTFNVTLAVSAVKHAVTALCPQYANVKLFDAPVFAQKSSETYYSVTSVYAEIFLMRHVISMLDKYESAMMQSPAVATHDMLMI